MRAFLKKYNQIKLNENSRAKVCFETNQLFRIKKAMKFKGTLFF